MHMRRGVLLLLLLFFFCASVCAQPRRRAFDVIDRTRAFVGDLIGAFLGPGDGSGEFDEKTKRDMERLRHEFESLPEYDNVVDYAIFVVMYVVLHMVLVYCAWCNWRVSKWAYEKAKYYGALAWRGAVWMARMVWRIEWYMMLLSLVFLVLVYFGYVGQRHDALAHRSLFVRAADVWTNSSALSYMFYAVKFIFGRS